MSNLALITLAVQLALIVFSGARLSGVFGKPDPVAIGIHVGCLVVNLCGAALMTVAVIGR